ncbi:MAG: hypothetical protein LBQ41_03075 [Candidatus Ancillula sp.]|nr:hypothetical protein [Candidatus Ancillula sp.]
MPLFVFALAFLGIAVATFAVLSTPNEEEKLEILVPDGIPLASFAGFAQSESGVAATQLKDGVFPFSDEMNALLGKKTSLRILNGADQLSAAMIDKPKAAVVPLSMAARFFHSDGYKIMHIASFGLNEIVGNTEVQGMGELVGKKVYSFAKNDIPGLVLRTLIREDGGKVNELADDNDVLDPSAVNILEFNDAQSAGAAKLKSQDAADVFAFLPEPVATSIAEKSDGSLKVTDPQQFWKRLFHTDQPYPQSALIIRKDIAESAGYAETFSVLCLGMGLSSQLASEDVDKLVEIMRGDFNSTSFANAGAVKLAIRSGRIPQSDGSTLRPEMRSSVLAFLKTLALTSEQPDKVLGGDVPDESIFADLQQK